MMPGCDALYTFDFVRSALPAGARRVLEIGCGDGAVAAMLGGSGLEVLALDSDEAAVASARARGVDARCAEWPHGDLGAGFDAILFTRSLHHVHELEEAVAAAIAALAPGGRIVVEDFAFGEADEPTLAWFRDLALDLRRQGSLGSSDLVDGLIAAEPPLAPWGSGEHDHHLHPAARIGMALRAASASVTGAPAAYYFRYLLAAGATAQVAEAALASELELIADGSINPLGRRWVATADA